MLLQQHHADLLSENILSNSIIGTCIASNHLNLFITFLQQTIDINLGKIYTITNKEPSTEENKPVSDFPDIYMPTYNRKQLKITIMNRQSKRTKDVWNWKYLPAKNSKTIEQHSLIYLIIQRDWQGALSLILNEVDRFHLNYTQIIEGAILNNKLNLVLRLLYRLKDEFSFHETNSHQQNLFHLLANMNEYDENLLKQILLFLSENPFKWNTPDRYGSYPLHYACVKQNFAFLNFLREKYPGDFNLHQADAFENRPVGLLFWSLGPKTAFANDKLRAIIPSGQYLDSHCNYNNQTALDPLSFNCARSISQEIVYPPVQSDGPRTTPLIHAIVHHNFLLTQFLLQLDANVNSIDENKQTPLMYAVRQVGLIVEISNQLFFLFRTISIWSDYS